jgi:hypothetical protein
MNNRILVLTGTMLALGAAVAVAKPAQAHGGFGAWGGDRQENLADALGITVDELEAAQLKAHTAALEAAVAAGRITQEDADLRLARMKVAQSFDKDAALAEALGISSAELDEARADGTLQDLAEEKDVTGETLRAAMTAAWSEALDEAVKAGSITQEQADTLEESGALGGCGGRHSLGGAGLGRGAFRSLPGAGTGEGARFIIPRAVLGNDV